MTATQIKPEKPKLPETAVIPGTIHLSFAKFGRTGKSTFLKLLIEYFIAVDKPYLVVDTDAETPDVAKAYTPDLLNSWLKGDTMNNGSVDSIFAPTPSPSKSSQTDSLLIDQIVFSKDNRDEHLTRNLLSLAQLGNDVLVNLAANVYTPVCNFIENNPTDVQFVNWWVSNGSTASLDLFIETQARFPDMTHILVLNKGMHDFVDKWDKYRLPSEIINLYNDGKVKVAMIPFLSINKSLWESLQETPYNKIIQDKSIDSVTRGAIETWIKRALNGDEKNIYSISQTECIQINSSSTSAPTKAPGDT
jgi:hypothetical protein